MSVSYTGTKKYSKGPEVEVARQAMIDAKQAPKNVIRDEGLNSASGLSTEIVATLTFESGRESEEITGADRHSLVRQIDARSKELKQEGESGRVKVTYETRPVATTTVNRVAQTVPTVVTKSVTKTNLERVETKDFVATIKQENGKWVSELVYKNGAGTERFVADSKNALTMQMLVGKGNASVKVRKVIREQKYGVELDKSYLFPNLTQEQYDAMPEAAKQELVDAAALKASVTFKQQHPEYYSTAGNWDKIKRFLDKRELPYTYSNLEYAYADLTDNDELEVKQEVIETLVDQTLPDPEDSGSAAPAATQPVAASTPVLRKRGTTGIVPGTVSTGNDVLNDPEESTKPRELSDAELKALPLADHKKLYQASLNRKIQNRQF